MTKCIHYQSIQAYCQLCEQRQSQECDVLGAEFAHQYLRYHEVSFERPLKELKGFGKIYL